MILYQVGYQMHTVYIFVYFAKNLEDERIITWFRR